jgi:hypothetical protein
MDPRQDDFAPAGSNDAGGTLYRATHDESRSESQRQRRSGRSHGRSQDENFYNIQDSHGVCAPTTRIRLSSRRPPGQNQAGELEIASPAVDGNVLRFIRTFEQYIKENRPDSTNEEVIGLFRFFSLML